MIYNDKYTYTIRIRIFIHDDDVPHGIIRGITSPAGNTAG